MCISKLVNTIVIAAAIGVFGIAATAHANGGTIIGRVAHGGSDPAVRVCFNRDIAVQPGDEFAVVRHTLRPTSPKAAPIFESAQVGVLRIAAPTKGSCATAVVVSGSAQWLDWVSIKADS
jgi:hypothetical protein